MHWQVPDALLMAARHLASNVAQLACVNGIFPTKCWPPAHALCAPEAPALWRASTYQQCVSSSVTSPPSQKTDSEATTLSGMSRSTLHVQVSIASRSSAIHSAYRSLLRPSLLLKPRHPSLNVVCAEWLTFLHRNAAVETQARRMATRLWGEVGWGRARIVHLQTEFTATVIEVSTRGTLRSVIWQRWPVEKLILRSYRLLDYD